ncbi:MAG: hypothetical protein WBA13_23130 [Microcoleaceae cyanobacterium]
MVTKQMVRCSNCGSLCERYHSEEQIRTQCQVCDYLMVTCTRTGKVIEAYAPGLHVRDLQLAN